MSDANRPRDLRILIDDVLRQGRMIPIHYVLLEHLVLRTHPNRLMIELSTIILSDKRYNPVVIYGLLSAICGEGQVYSACLILERGVQTYKYCRHLPQPTAWLYRNGPRPHLLHICRHQHKKKFFPRHAMHLWMKDGADVGYDTAWMPQILSAHNIQRNNAAYLAACCAMIGSELLVRPATGSAMSRFWRIATALPWELQLRLCAIVAGAYGFIDRHTYFAAEWIDSGIYEASRDGPVPGLDPAAGWL